MSDGTGQEGTEWDESLSWDAYFLEMARLVASKSRDPSTKCGCVIVAGGREVLTTGYNGFPRGIKYTPERLPRKRKYQLVCHAESNAITNAARLGHALMGSTAYVTGPPCRGCALLLIQAGVNRVCIPADHNFKRRFDAGDWDEEMKDARQLLAEARVRYCII